jgi:hypothetical protein
VVVVVVVVEVVDGGVRGVSGVVHAHVKTKSIEGCEDMRLVLCADACKSGRGNKVNSAHLRVPSLPTDEDEVVRR